MKKPVKTASIQDIMNQMAGHMDVILDRRDAAAHGPAAAALMDEVQMWLSVDPLLAELHKQYLDARAHHAKIQARHGDGDPMTDIAADMKDSAQCAVDTRIIELRQDAEARTMLQFIIRKAAAAREADLVAAECDRSTRFWRDFAVRKAPSAVARAGNSFFMMMVTLMALQQIADQAYRQLQIADVFSRASGPRRLSAASG